MSSEELFHPGGPSTPRPVTTSSSNLSLSPSARMLQERTPLLMDKDTIRQQLGIQPRASTPTLESNAQVNDDFVTVDDRVEGALQKCFNEVIQPFGIFLCCIGWRPFAFERQTSFVAQAVSVGYPLLVWGLLMCNYSYGMIYAAATGKTALFSELLLQSCVSLALWIFGMWFFRRDDGKAFQEISALIETVFLRFGGQASGKLSQTALSNTLRSYLAYGVYGLLMYLGVALWIAFTGALELFDLFTPSVAEFVICSAVVCIGYVAEYAVYIGTMVIYYICARLLIRYMDWMRDELVRRNIDVVVAEKEVFMIRKLLNDLNSGWSIALSLLSFSLAVRSLLYHIHLILDIETLDRVQAGVQSAISVVFLFLCLHPVATITARGIRLKGVAWKVRAEQKYRTSNREDLDSFYHFMMHAPLQARVLGVPVYRELVYMLILGIVTIVFVLWRLGLYDIA